MNTRYVLPNQKRGLRKMPTILVFAIALVWSWQGFKNLEPKLFPVVVDFTYQVERNQDGTMNISGEMNKVRDCPYQFMAVYDKAVSPMRMLDIDFNDTPSNQQSKELGLQAYGPWKISPSTKNIRIVVTHECSTGLVKTTLYDGAI